jgi:membrane protease subunit HflC
MKKTFWLYFFIVLFLLALANPFYIIGEAEQAIVLRLGDPVKTVTESSAMPHVKVPLIDTVLRFEKRLLVYDSPAKDINTKDKKLLRIDNYCRWRISDPDKFFEVYKTEHQAQARIDDVVFSKMREEIAKYTMAEVVATHREEIMHNVSSKSHEELIGSGVDIADVRIKMADLPPENAKSVFSRMEAERKQEARLYRSEGEEEYLNITSGAQRDVEVIMSEAYKEAEEIRGEGDAEALKIYAEAFERDPEFYEFWRTLRAYREAMKGDTTLIMSSDSEFLKFLKGYD